MEWSNDGRILYGFRGRPETEEAWMPDWSVNYEL